MSEFDVKLSGVSKRFGSFVAVNNVSFGIRKGGFFSLLGPSGCGKTTIMRMISGFETASEGDISIGGKLMKDQPPYRRPTNLVFQHLALFPHMTVNGNIAFGLEMSGTSRAETNRRVGEMLELIELPGYGKRRIDQLSGGQKQRVAIARALVGRPTVLLLDEPLGALDLKLREQMQLELKRIQREVGTTFIYVTHDQKEAITMSDQIAVMNRGVVEQIGDASEIYENPKTAFVAGFIGDTNLFRGRVASTSGMDTVIECEGMTIRAKARATTSVGDAVAIAVRPEKLVVGAALADCENRYEVVIQDAIYLGSHTHYLARLRSGAAVSVLVQNAERAGGPSPGERVEIGWRAERGVVITEAGT